MTQREALKQSESFSLVSYPQTLQPLTYFLSLWICLLWTFHINVLCGLRCLASFIYFFIFLFYFILFLNFTILYWFLKNPCIPGIKPTWSWCMIFLMCCWILIARILLRIFASMFISDIGL